MGNETALVSKRELTERQELFVEAYVANGGHSEQAAIEAGYAKSSARTAAGACLRNPLIQRRIYEASIRSLAQGAPAALDTVGRLMRTARSEKVRLDAAIDWLNRAGFKPAERHEHHVSGELSVSIDLS